MFQRQCFSAASWVSTSTISCQKGSCNECHPMLITFKCKSKDIQCRQVIFNNTSSRVIKFFICHHLIDLCPFQLFVLHQSLSWTYRNRQATTLIYSVHWTFLQSTPTLLRAGSRPFTSHSPWPQKWAPWWHEAIPQSFTTELNTHPRHVSGGNTPNPITSRCSIRGTFHFSVYSTPLGCMYVVNDQASTSSGSKSLRSVSSIWVVLS